jgi:CBS domain-containing protein
VTHAAVVKGVTDARRQVRLVWADSQSVRWVFAPELLKVDDALGLALFEVKIDRGFSGFGTLPFERKMDLEPGTELNGVGYPTGVFEIPKDLPDPPQFSFAYGYGGQEDPFRQSGPRSLFHIFGFPELFISPDRVVARGGKTLVVKSEARVASWPSPGSPYFGTPGLVEAIAAPGRRREAADGVIGAGRIARLLAGVPAPVRLPDLAVTTSEGGDRGVRATARLQLSDAPARGEPAGAAFCVGRNGQFVTNAHLVPREGAVRLVLDPGSGWERTVPAQVLRRDDDGDLALLEVEPDERLEALALGEDRAIFTTLRLDALGFRFPQGRVETILCRVTTVVEDRRTHELAEILLDVALNPGHSGGPVIDEDGRVLGVAVATSRGVLRNAVIPVGRLRAFLKP